MAFAVQYLCTGRRVEHEDPIVIQLGIGEPKDLQVDRHRRLRFGVDWKFERAVLHMQRQRRHIDRIAALDSRCAVGLAGATLRSS